MSETGHRLADGNKTLLPDQFLLQLLDLAKIAEEPHAPDHRIVLREDRTGES